MKCKIQSIKMNTYVQIAVWVMYGANYSGGDTIDLDVIKRHSCICR